MRFAHLRRLEQSLQRFVLAARRKRGQSMVEYILICGLVAGVLAVFRAALIPNLVTTLKASKVQAEREAWKGGDKSSERLGVRSFYAGSSSSGGH